MIFVTKEWHNNYHHCSEETRKKRSASLKGIPRTDEWRKRLSESGKGKHNLSEEQRLQISKSVREYYEQDGSREKTSIATMEAMWRPEVRQRLLDGCKKRPPLSKEARQKAAEAIKARPISDDDICEFVKYFNEVICVSKLLDIKELSHIVSLYKETHKVSWNTFQKLYKNVKHTLLQKETV